MNVPPFFAWAYLSAALSTPVSSFASEQAFRGKITVESQAPAKSDFEQPCFLVYPEGLKREMLRDAKGDALIESKLQKLGYHLVSDPNQAEVFVKVDFAQLPPFEAQVILKSKGAFDYSHSASTRNYAATLFGGRYQQLGNPDRLRETGATGFVLDPEGKPIDVGQQESFQVKYEEGEDAAAVMTLHPSAFQVAAWSFDEANPRARPSQLWSTTSYLENLIEEPLEDQIGELADAAVKQLGKNFSKPKVVRRKPKSHDG